MAKNRVFIVTTRHYPIDNGDYQPIGPSYHDTFSNDAEARKAMFEDSRATWHTYTEYQYNKSLPIKYRAYQNAHIYVAPCLRSEDRKDKESVNPSIKDSYLESVLKSVLEDLKSRQINDFDAYLFIHDFDFGVSGNNKMAIDDYADDALGCPRHNYSEYHKQLFGDLNEKKIESNGYYYQHTEPSSIFAFVKFIIGESYNEELISSLEGKFDVLLSIFNNFKDKITLNKVNSANKEESSDTSWDKESIKNCINEFIKSSNISTTLTVGIKVRKHAWGKRAPEKSFKQLIEDLCCKTPMDHQSVEIKTKTRIVPVINIFLKSGSESVSLETMIQKTGVRFGNYFDSSIWNYVLFKDSHFDEQLDRIINEIREYCSKNYYELKVSREFINLNMNLFEDSHLSGSHGDHVVPFIFHSESKHKETAKKEYVENGENNWIYRDGSFTYKWRILLLDDHALRRMNCIGDDDTDRKRESRNEYIGEVPDKLRIVSDDLRRLYPDIKIGYVNADKSENNQEANVCIYDELTNKPYENSDDFNIVFYCVSNVNDALQILKVRRFEIVLLDYLLGEKDDNSREYSYELLNMLKKIYGPDKKDTIFGPHGRLYFSFISAFTTAVNERLLAEGLHKSEKFWHIADGACPTNTPYLFLYNLLHLMNKRVEDMGIPKLSKITKEDFKVSYVKTKLIDTIYNVDDVRKMANEKFDEVMSLLYHYKKLLEYTHNTPKVFDSEGSVLAAEFIKTNPSLGGFLEHLTQLVYLTAFGTVRQWPEMWEEYQYISSIVGPQPKIEDYIVKLKSNF